MDYILWAQSKKHTVWFERLELFMGKEKEKKTTKPRSQSQNLLATAHDRPWGCAASLLPRTSSSIPGGTSLFGSAAESHSTW